VRRWAPYILILVASVGAAIWSANIAVQQGQDTTFNAQQNARDNTVAGCHRSALDRADAVRGWSAARQARLATAHDPKVPQEARLSAAGAAAVYKVVIEGYRSRIVNCEQAFPPVRR
jgi:hypothetical protein